MNFLKSFKVFESFSKPEMKYPINYKCLDIMAAMYEIDDKFQLHLTEIPAKNSKYGTMNFFGLIGKKKPLFPKYTSADDSFNYNKNKYKNTGIPNNMHRYFEDYAIYEVPKYYD